MLVRVVGQIAVGDASGTKPITSPRQRMVLAILAANNGVTISSGRLLELIWPEGPPASAETSLQVTISQLRKHLEPSRAPRQESRYLTTRGAGYRLDLADDELDLELLRRSIEATIESPTDANRQSMVERWAPPIFAEFHDASWARPIVESFDERRLVAIARHAIDAIEHGRADEITPAIQAELAERPLEERLAGLVMLGFARQGRQADALAVYETIRRRLRDDLGLEPTVQLRSLERSILEHDPNLFRPDGAAPAQRLQQPDSTSSASSLIGRDTDLEQLSSLLGSERLITIVGPAGAGKTSVAHEVVRISDRRRTFFVDLSAVATNDRVARAIADTIGLLEEPTADTTDALVSALDREPTLLVLDNCEELVEGVVSVAQALLRAPNVSILTTSRRLLELSSEVSFRLQPLGQPEDGADPTDVFEAPACRLLIERSGLEVGAEEAPSIGRIARLLDGLPLALELGAYRLRVAGTARLLDDLEVERDLAGPPDANPTQRSLDAALDRSVQSLPDVSRDALVALGTFGASVPMKAIQLILEGRHDAEAVEASVFDLVDRSLVTSGEVGRDGSTRSVFGLLETVRSYARRMARSDGAESAWRDRHVEVVAEVALSSRGARPDAAITIADLANEIARALDHLEETARDGETHHQLVTNIGSYWYRAGRLREAFTRMRTAIDLYPDVDPLWRGITLAAAGLMSFSSGQFRQLVVLLEEAIGILSQLGMPGLELLEAAQLVARGDLDGVEERVTTALSSPAIAGMQRAIALDVAAYSGWFGGNYDIAIERFHQQEHAAALAGDVFLQGRAIRGRGLMLAYQGSPESGALLCQQSVEMIDDWENDRSAAQCMAIRSAIQLAIGRHEEARQDALGAMRRAATRFDGNPMMVAVPVMASIEADAGRFESVARITGWLRGICDATGMYLPAESERLATEAETKAAADLDAEVLRGLRADGAENGLAGLVADLTA